MTRVELHGFGANSIDVLNQVRDLLARLGYFDLARINFSIVQDTVIDFEGNDKPFVRVMSPAERNWEIAGVINRELQLSAEFIVASNYPNYP